MLQEKAKPLKRAYVVLSCELEADLEQEKDDRIKR